MTQENRMLIVSFLLIVMGPVAMARVVDLTHIYGPDVLYPPVGPNGTADLFNFTIIHHGYEPKLDAWYVLTLSMLGKKFSRWHFKIFFSLFPGNRLWHIMKIVLHEILKPILRRQFAWNFQKTIERRQICMKCHSLFSRNNKKKN